MVRKQIHHGLGILIVQMPRPQCNDHSTMFYRVINYVFNGITDGMIKNVSFFRLDDLKRPILNYCYKIVELKLK